MAWTRGRPFQWGNWAWMAAVRRLNAADGVLHGLEQFLEGPVRITHSVTAEPKLLTVETKPLPLRTVVLKLFQCSVSLNNRSQDWEPEWLFCWPVFR